MYEVYKNSTITGTPDAGGITNTTYDGQSVLGTDFFTGLELEDADEVISRRLVCDRCGHWIKEKSELIRQNGWNVCWRCIDG